MSAPSLHRRRGLHAAAAIVVAAAIGATGLPAAETAPGDPENSEHGGEPLPPDAALEAIRCRLPATVSLWAAEPVIRNPVAATVDTAGRLLVAENLSYAEKPIGTHPSLRDRVVMLEDHDGDGRAEHHATLVDGLETLSGVATGRGGLWVLCPPRLLFIPGGHLPPPGWPDAADAEEAARRRGAAVPLLDGFTPSKSSHHTFANGLAWGPDGWLYGRSGASSPGEVGAPGAPPEDRVPLRGGIWRYHPERHVFEAVCHGTTNPWGLDWDDRGEGFFTNTVNGHLWRVLPGAHYARSHTLEPHSWIGDPLGPHADHDHFDTSRHWSESRDGRADAHGGGHAHTGCLVVPDEPGWPGALCGRLLTLNLHGRRINVDRLDVTRQGIVGRHEEDLALFGDPFFRGTDIVELPGRACAVLDWSDTGECHEGTGVHRSSGRVWRFAFAPGAGPPAPLPPGTDLAALPAADLVRLLAADRWHARMATRVLADRHAAGDAPRELAGIVPALEALLADGGDDRLRLRGLWALSAIGAIDEPRLLALLDDRAWAVRRQAVRLLADAWPIDTVLGGRPAREGRQRGDALDALEWVALGETDPEVRLALAGTLVRLPPGDRARLARAVVSGSQPVSEEGTDGAHPGDTPPGPRAPDGDHHDLGAILWSGLVGAIPLDPAGTLAVWKTACRPGAEASHWPGLRRAIARRLTAPDGLPHLPGLLAAASAEGAAGLDDCLAGLAEGWRGRQRVEAPDGWDEVHAAVAAIPEDDPRRPLLTDAVARLDALFGSARGGARLAAVAGDRALPVVRRRAALEALADVRAAELAAVARECLLEAGLGPAAIRGLLAGGAEEDARRLLAALPRLDAPARAAALAALASRAPWADLLLDAIERGEQPRDLLDPLLLRQIRGLGRGALAARADALAGAALAPDAPRTGAAARVDAWKARLTPAILAAADPAAGRAEWERQCAACHRLHGAGGTLGPDLTGSGRHDLDYLLANIVAPSAGISPEYSMKQVVLADGRVLSGIIARRTTETILLRTPTGEETLAAADVERVVDGGVSLMPEGILERLDEGRAAALIRFLMDP